ncbi:hypothetical protein [Cellulomonas composti]|uniref:Carboxypeptidase regulatory-like domain-containing protein n=1 Tax=Cellulomonas composti TaxID=266130 RepID=A0A511J910_9CELL|nr:hypothetical protein [Cellulomonas composti]GEL94476.1 hypothetical protein CCO02nite_11340 [Cellulomonas composti]
MSVSLRRLAPAALAALLALLLTALLGASPAAAAGSSIIKGTVTVPAGASLEAQVVLAWLPTAKGSDFASVAVLDEKGRFVLTGLTSGTGYQISVLDVTGKVASGYYTPAGLVPAAAQATLLRTGTTGISLRTAASARATAIRIVLPADGAEPSWPPQGFYVVEPGNGRLTALAGNVALSSATASSVASALSATGQWPTAPRTTSLVASGSTGAQVVSFPTRGLASGAAYTFAIPYGNTDNPAGFLKSFYYSGDDTVITKKLSAAATFTGATTRIDVHVLGATAKTPPTVTGTAKVGALVRSSKATWDLAGTVTFQWLRDGVAIAGATSSAYRVQDADRGARLSVRETLRPKVAGYANGVSTSARVPVV